MGNCEMLCDNTEPELNNQIIIFKHKKERNVNSFSTSTTVHNLTNNLNITNNFKGDNSRHSSNTKPYTKNHRSTFKESIPLIIKIQQAYQRHLNQLLQLIAIKEESHYYLGYSLSNHRVIKHKFGVLKWTDGDVYKGEFYNDYYQGIGRYYTETTGATYTGMFKNNEMNGFGVETWKLGSVYIGEYCSKEKNGIGCIRFDDGNSYEGEFKGNNINGYGMLVIQGQGKETLKGFFRNNKIERYCLWEDKEHKRSFEGEVNNEGIWDGYGVLYEMNIAYVGKWRNGKLEGNVVVVMIKEGRMEKYEYRNDKEVRKLEDGVRTVYDKIGMEIINEKAERC